jgi:hypothetical protein
MLAKEHAGELEIFSLMYPPRVANTGLWQIRSQVSGNVPVEISFLTSGLSWRAFYLGTLTPDETAMRLEGYVVVSNQSGEDYDNAQVRLIVGQVHLLDEIAMLAQRQPPYGRPGGEPPRPTTAPSAAPMEERAAAKRMLKSAESLDRLEAKQVVKEGLSEYFLYTIEGQETIATGWQKRLPSFAVDTVPVVNLYKYDEQQYGALPRRFISFKNDKAHHLGETPIPDGTLSFCRTADGGHLAYEGASGFKYIPVDQEAELDLGEVANLLVEPTLMSTRTDNYVFNQNGDISGWDETRVYKMELKNTREVPAKLQVTRHFDHPYWELKNEGDYGDYTKLDVTSARYTQTIPPRTTRTFTYTLLLHQGDRAR